MALRKTVRTLAALMLRVTMAKKLKNKRKPGPTKENILLVRVTFMRGRGIGYRISHFDEMQDSG